MESQTPKNKLNTLRIIHFALMLGLVTFGGLVLFLNFTRPIEEPISDEILLYLPSAFFLMAFLASGPLFKILIKKTHEESLPLSEKLIIYQTAHLVKMALTEGAGLLACVICLITGTINNMIWLALVLGYFVLNIPSVTRLTTDMNLKVEEREQFVA